ncbi:hypothetical protein WJX73_001070 [Symbiochloris irregularis]|uniref:Protein kinase domain-containing protein n=1 Tax=Symbiochloris irregularis TaxID=706552 RepID=A0AAW1PEW4_9CHLO
MLQLAVSVLLLALSDQTLVWSAAAPTSSAADDTVRVSSSDEFLNALSNEAVQNISISGRVIFGAADAANGANVDHSLTITAESGPGNALLLTNSQAQLTVENGATVVLSSLEIDAQAPPEDASHNLLWPSVSVLPGALVVYSDVVVSFQATCSQLLQVFPMAEQLSASELFIDNSTLRIPEGNGYGVQQVEAVTIICGITEDQLTVEVSTPAEFLANVNDTAVTSIVVNGSIYVDHEDVNESIVVNRSLNIIAARGQQPVIDFGEVCGVISVAPSAHVTFTNLTLQGTGLPQNCTQQPWLQDTFNTTLLPQWGFTPFPAMFVAGNSTVSMLHTVLRADFADCSEPTMQGFMVHYDLSQPSSSLQSQGNTSVLIEGAHIVKVPLAVMDQNTVVAVMRAVLDDFRLQCIMVSDGSGVKGPAGFPADQGSGVMPLPDPNAPPNPKIANPLAVQPLPGPVLPIPPDPVAAANARLSGTTAAGRQGGGSSLSWWSILLISLGSVVAGVVLITVIIAVSVLVAARKRRRLGQPAGKSLPVLKRLNRLSSITEAWLHRAGSDSTESLQRSQPSVPAPVPEMASTQIDEAAQLAQLEIGDLLGYGSYGRVFKGVWHGAMVAVKQVEMQVLEGQPEPTLESVRNVNLSHPNIVHTYHILSTIREQARPHFDLEQEQDEAPPEASSSSAMGRKRSTKEVTLVLEYCDKGSLEQAIDCGWFHHRDLSRPNMARTLQSLRDIACGANYLHAAGVLHGDLKPANVLLQSRGFASSSRALPYHPESAEAQTIAAERVPSSTPVSGITCKLADFGLSRVLSADASHLTTHSFGTVTHMPPELLRDGIFSRAADVYSFAMIMWELLTGSRLYPGMSATRVAHMVAYEGARPDLPADCPPGYMRLMTSCWQADPQLRPTFETILQEVKALRLEEQGLSPASTPRILLHQLHDDMEADDLAVVVQ